MALQKTLTPALIRKLNAECENIRGTNPHTWGCFDCIGVGWCDTCWRHVAGDVSDGKMVGNLDNGGPDHG